MAGWIYIGRLDDPDFIWNSDEVPHEKWRISNVPRPITPNFPPIARDRSTSGLGHEMVTGMPGAKQTDWGAWVAPVRKSELLGIFEDLFEAVPQYAEDTTMPWLRADYLRLKHAVNAFDDDEVYALVYATL